MEKINIDKVINKWFDIKYLTYDKLYHDDSIYLYYDDKEYADIRILKKIKYIYYEWSLYEEFYEMIRKEPIEFNNFMSKWVEDNFNLKEFTPLPASLIFRDRLKIPK